MVALTGYGTGIYYGDIGLLFKVDYLIAGTIES
jgi:hypothetical protein